MRSRSFVVRVLAAGGLVAFLACSPDSEPAQDPVPSTAFGKLAKSHWYISRFGGPERKWRFDFGQVKPQKRPAMLIYEITQFPGPEVTQVHEEAADALLVASHRAALENGWYDYEAGMASGYELQFNDEAHYVNREFLFDDGLLDPTRPEFLMYYDTSLGKRLVGFMFYVQNARARGPQVGGPLTTWHFHVWSSPHCFIGGIHAIGVPNAKGACERGRPASRSPEMLHVWLVDHPKGPFARRMRISPPLLERLVRERGF